MEPSGSNAYQTFLANLYPVIDLLDIHESFRRVPLDRGGAPLGPAQVLNKAAVVFICACWEACVEDVCSEALSFMLSNGPSPDRLPKQLKKLVARKLVAREAKNEKHELGVWTLAGTGWMRVVKDQLGSRIEEMRTPTAEKVNSLFSDLLGLKSVSSNWHWPGMPAQKASAKLGKYIGLRGKLAHRGPDETPVRKETVLGFLKHVVRLAKCSDNLVRAQVRSLVGGFRWEEAQLPQTRSAS